MNKTLRFWLTWTPRSLGIAFTLLMAMFALDVFDGQTPFWGAVVGFLIHLLPAVAVGAVLLVAWKYELPGGLLFILLAALYTFWIRRELDITGILLMVFLPVLIGILFLAHWWLKRRVQPSSESRS